MFMLFILLCLVDLASLLITHRHISIVSIILQALGRALSRKR